MGKLTTRFQEEQNFIKKQNSGRMTRNNFNATKVLEFMKTSGAKQIAEPLQVLEEACHYIVRLESKSKNAANLIHQLYAFIEKGDS